MDVSSAKVISAITTFIEKRYGFDVEDVFGDCFVCKDQEGRYHFMRGLWYVDKDDTEYKKAKKALVDGVVRDIPECPEKFFRTEDQLLEDLPWNYSGVVELRVLGDDRALLSCHLKEEAAYATD